MTNKIKPLTVTKEEDGQRLDKWIKFRFNNVSKVMMEKLCRTGQIRVDSSRVKPSVKLVENQQIRIPNFIRTTFQKSTEILTKEKSYLFNELRKTIVYEDEYFFIFNKPYGLAVQGGTKLGQIHLDGILPFFSKKENPIPKLVHRLDKETSGILVVAKTPKSAKEFSKLMTERKISKTYWALVQKSPKNKLGILYSPFLDNTLIKKDLIKKYSLEEEFNKAKFITLQSEQKETVSTYEEILVINNNYFLLKLLAVTGRKHQLRKQLAKIGSPILGDYKYGSTDNFFKKRTERLQLHARKIIFLNPITGKLINVKCSPPDHMGKILYPSGINKQ